MRFRPRSGYLIYDDTSVNDYYDFGEGQGGMFVYTVGYVDGVKKQAWLVADGNTKNMEERVLYGYMDGDYLQWIEIAPIPQKSEMRKRGNNNTHGIGY